MADFFAISVDDRALEQAITAMPEVLQRHVLDACELTTDAVVAEMRSRLQRQLGAQATGETVGNITKMRAFDGNGFVILSDNPTTPNVPLWLEKGTKAGKRRNFARTAPRPFFYASLAVEAGPHERRILQAMHDAAGESGLVE